MEKKLELVKLMAFSCQSFYARLFSTSKFNMPAGSQAFVACAKCRVCKLLHTRRPQLEGTEAGHVGFCLVSSLTHIFAVEGPQSMQLLRKPTLSHFDKSFWTEGLAGNGKLHSHLSNVSHCQDARHMIILDKIARSDLTRCGDSLCCLIQCH